MTIYRFKDILPNGCHKENNTIIINKNTELDFNDIIIIEQDMRVIILPKSKIYVMKIINYGEIENGGELFTFSLENYGLIKNIDLLVVEKGSLYNNGIINNYYYLYLLKSSKINNDGKLNNYSFVGGIIFIDKEKLFGNNLNLF